MGSNFSCWDGYKWYSQVDFFVFSMELQAVAMEERI